MKSKSVSFAEDSLQLQQYVTSQLKLYVQPTILSFGMRHLPSILHLVAFRISSVRVSLKEDSVVFLLDSIDTIFDVNYDQNPAIISPESVLEPETPAEVTSPAPPSSFPLPPINEEVGGPSSAADGTRVYVGRRGWNSMSLWRRIMRRASGHIDVTVIVSECRVLRGATAHAEKAASTSARSLPRSYWLIHLISRSHRDPFGRGQVDVESHHRFRSPRESWDS